MQREANHPESAFAKASAYLNFNARAKWLAQAAAVGTGLVTVALLTVLWLFTDLMVSRGRIPDWQELTPRQQKNFIGMWKGLSSKERRERLSLCGIDPGRADALAGENAEFEDLPSSEVDRVWDDQARRILFDSVGPAAVARVDRTSPPLPAEVVGALVAGVPADPSGVAALAALRVLAPPHFLDRGNHGILSLVVREKANGHVWTPVPALARWNQWAWNHPNTRLPSYLTGLFLISVLLTLVGAGLLVLMREMAAQATIEATTQLRRAVYHHTFRLGTLAIRALGPSEAVSILTRHVEAVHDALYTRLTSLVREPVLLVLLLIFVFLLHPLLSLAFLLFAVVVWILGAQVVTYSRNRAQQANTQAAERLTIIRESLMMMRLVKCYLMEQFNQARIERQLSRYAQVQLGRYRSEALSRPLLLFLGAFAVLVLLYVAALTILWGQLSAASAVVLAAALLCLYRPLERYLDARRLLKRGKEAAGQVFQFLERKGEVGQVVGAEFLPPLAQQIEFDGVSLRDPSTGRQLLEEVSITIPAGQRVGLIGADNLEKHALVYLIPRLLDPTAGEVRIDQHNLRWVTLDSLRVQIGIVMMHNLVFHDSVANNIGCGDSAYTLPQIIEAAKVAHAHHFIQKLPQGYETPIGELGHTLAVSEQFRIALARAILRDPALLIVEEPETDLDEDTKNLLDDTLARVLPGRTAIFLPHRISTIRNCDTVYLLNKGRVVASGLHKDLLAKNPLYRHLHYLEFNEMDE